MKTPDIGRLFGRKIIIGRDGCLPVYIGADKGHAVCLFDFFHSAIASCFSILLIV